MQRRRLAIDERGAHEFGDRRVGDAAAAGEVEVAHRAVGREAARERVDPGVGDLEAVRDAERDDAALLGGERLADGLEAGVGDSRELERLEALHLARLHLRDILAAELGAGALRLDLGLGLAAGEGFGRAERLSATLPFGRRALARDEGLRAVEAGAAGAERRRVLRVVEADRHRGGDSSGGGGGGGENSHVC